MKISNYINDGANWQAQAVLAYLRNYEDTCVNTTWRDDLQDYEATLNVGRYENCREQGYVFSLKYKLYQFNFAVYEHRNTDRLCVVAWEQLTTNTPTLDDVCKAMGDNKWNTTQEFSYGSITECGAYIVDSCRNMIEHWKTDWEAKHNKHNKHI